MPQQGVRLVMLTKFNNNVTLFSAVALVSLAMTATTQAAGRLRNTVSTRELNAPFDRAVQVLKLDFQNRCDLMTTVDHVAVFCSRPGGTAFLLAESGAGDPVPQLLTLCRTGWADGVDRKMSQSRRHGPYGHGDALARGRGGGGGGVISVRRDRSRSRR